MKKIELNSDKTWTTGIGSLPHSYIDSALDYSFRHTLPFLPQIPMRNPREFMVFQSLHGLPGLKEGNQSEPILDLNEWANKTHGLKKKLDLFFEDPKKLSSEFEPAPEVYSSWRPFLFECEEQGRPYAKIQIAGPLTSQWTLKIFDGKKTVKPEEVPDLSTQIFQLILAKALSMGRALKNRKITPLLYLDEPALYVFDQTNPFHGLSLQELSFCVDALNKEEILTGLHCCSNPQWRSLLKLNLKMISFDVNMALDSLFEHSEDVKSFVQKGGCFSFGIIPTSPSLHEGSSHSGDVLLKRITQGFTEILGSSSTDFLKSCLFTSACGLTYQSITECEEILDQLQKLRL